MTQIRNIDREKYAAKALELFNKERENFVRTACNFLNEGDTSEQSRERLTDRVESYMKRALFEYLKRSGAILGEIRHNYTYGYCRLKRVEPRMNDVPSSLLNISEILMMSEDLPKFADIIDSVMMDAGKLIMADSIEATTNEAK